MNNTPEALALPPVNQVGFVVDNVEEKVTEAEAFGYRQIWYKRFGEGLAASYLERDNDPLILEFFENKLG